MAKHGHQEGMRAARLLMACCSKSQPNRIKSAAKLLGHGGRTTACRGCRDLEPTRVAARGVQPRHLRKTTYVSPHASHAPGPRPLWPRFETVATTGDQMEAFVQSRVQNFREGQRSTLTRHFMKPGSCVLSLKKPRSSQRSWKHVPSSRSRSQQDSSDWGESCSSRVFRLQTKPRWRALL